MTECFAFVSLLKKAHEELNKRINEHDEYGASKGDITLPVGAPSLGWLLGDGI